MFGSKWAMLGWNGASPEVGSGNGNKPEPPTMIGIMVTSKSPRRS